MGNVYVTGDTASSDFPTCNPYQEGYGGGCDAFVTKLIFPGITVTSPNGGEIWQKETMRKIAWNPSGITGGVMIILLKGNTAIETIAKIKNPAASTYLSPEANRFLLPVPFFFFFLFLFSTQKMSGYGIHNYR